MPKNFVDVRQELFLCIWLSLTARRTHFEGQTSPEASIPLISMIFVCYRKPFVWWSGFRSQKCQKVLWTSVKNFFYGSGFPSRPVRPILKVKRAPKRAYPSFRRFSCAIANHFLGDPNCDVKKDKLFFGRSSRPGVTDFLNRTILRAALDGLLTSLARSCRLK